MKRINLFAKPNLLLGSYSLADMKQAHLHLERLPQPRRHTDHQLSALLPAADCRTRNKLLSRSPPASRLLPGLLGQVLREEAKGWLQLLNSPKPHQLEQQHFVRSSILFFSFFSILTGM